MKTEKIMRDKLAHVYSVLSDAIGRDSNRQRQAIENMRVYIAEYAEDDMNIINQNSDDYLRSMLGAKNNHPDEWGYRNHYTTTAGSVDCLHLQSMEDEGLVVQGNMSGSVIFHATEKGARSIGFTDEQIKRTDFTK